MVGQEKYITNNNVLRPSYTIAGVATNSVEKLACPLYDHFQCIYKCIHVSCVFTQVVYHIHIHIHTRTPHMLTPTHNAIHNNALIDTYVYIYI